MNYHNITHDDMLNGDGLRVVLWCSGCEHHCHNCQNPQTWDFNSGIPFDEEAKKELFEELEKDYISGITFSGGDPLNDNNVNTILKLVKETKNKFPSKTIWLYTGYKWEELINPIETNLNTKTIALRKQIVEQCDVIVDGRYKDSVRDITLKWRGSSNQRVIDVKETLKQGKVILYCD